MAHLLRMLCILALAGACLPAAGAPQPAGEDAFAACSARFDEAPEEYESSLCFYRAASRTGKWDTAAARLQSLEDAHPSITWLRLARAYVAWSAGRSGAEALYRGAADEFAAAGNLRGELIARSNLRVVLFRAGRVDEAAAEIARIAEIGRTTADADLRVRALVDQARHDLQTAANLGRAQSILRQARLTLEASHPYWLHKEVLHGLGSLSLHFGQYAEAVSYFEAMMEIARSNDDLAGLAQARFDVANATYEALMEMPRTDGHDKVLDLATVALETARAASSDRVAVVSHRLLAELSVHNQPARAADHLERCRAIAQRLSEPAEMSECLWNQARLVADRDPAAAQRLIDEAVALAEDIDDDTRLGHAWRHHMRISWQTRPLQAAVRESERALGVFESLREMQVGERGRAGVLAAWARDYYWLSGRLLQRAESESDEALVARALAVTERMRARTLLEALSATRPALSPDDPLEIERQQVLAGIVEQNRRLLGTADPAARGRILEALEALELRELELRDAITKARGAPVPADTSVATLAEIRDSLAADEALLSFQIAPWRDVSNGFGGGAWLVVITRETLQTARLPGRTAMADSVELMLGLLRGRRSVPEAEAGLYRRLLGQSLERLPAGIRRLIVVPDYPLHQFPLASLRRDSGGPTLGSEYELAIVPSATLWRQWRNGAPQSVGRGALVFANPQIRGAEHPRAAEWRSWALDSSLELGPLPHAESEGREVVARLGDSSELHVGNQASEATLKAAPVGRFRIIHFATHAVMDDANPERSAVMLAAGGSGEDGLLQVREIVNLPLDGQVVVLSSCQSATGTHVRGEGVQGLARAFFAAGASGVIGSLWPVRDDHARTFFAAFYRFLADGATAIGAFHDAQAELQAQGLPVEAWAGFQFLGDGSFAPVAASPAPTTSGNESGIAVWLAAASLLAALAAAGTWRAFRRRAIGGKVQG